MNHTIIGAFPDARKRRHVTVGAALLATAAMSLAACGSSSSHSTSASASGSTGSTAAPAVKSLAIGEIDSLTGGASVYGIPQHNGIELAVNQINSAGGVNIGGTTYRLDLTTVDDKTEPQTGVAVVQQLLSQDNIHFLIGTLSSEVASAYVPIIKSRTDLVDMVVGAAVAGITQNPSIYRPRVTSDQYTPEDVDWLDQLNQKSPVPNVAIIYDQTHAGAVQQLSTLNADLKAKNLKVVSQSAFTLGASNFDAQIASMLRNHAQSVIFEGYAPDAATFAKEARGQGFTGPIVTSVGFQASDIQKAAVPASAMADVYDVGAPFPADLIALNIDKDNASAFQSAYQAKYGKLPGFTSASAFDGVYILKKALEAAGTTSDFSAIYKALDTMKVSDVTNLAEAIIPQPDGSLFKSHQAYFQSAVHTWNGSAFVSTALIG